MNSSVVLAILGALAIGIAIVCYPNIECAFGESDPKCMEHTHQEIRSKFDEYVAMYSKSYTDVDEFEYRMNVFQDNLRKITLHNTQSETLGYTLGINKFGDLTLDEFRDQYLGLLPSEGYKSNSNQILNDVSNKSEASNPSLPVSLDWRNTGMITGVKDQGKCKASWAFSAISTIESILRINGRTTDLLSEQQLIDCTDTAQFQNEGCSGGRVAPCFDYAHLQSLCTSQDYPYVGADDNCRDWKICHTSYFVKGYVQLQTMNKLGLYTIDLSNLFYNNVGYILKHCTALTQQPVSLAVDANNLGWQFYQGGVLSSGCTTDVNHSVTAVGYNTYVYFWYWPYDYLIIKNSWGTSWGNNGYIYLSTNKEDYPGMCGAYMQMYYPLVN